MHMVWLHREEEKWKAFNVPLTMFNDHNSLPLMQLYIVGFLPDQGQYLDITHSVLTTLLSLGKHQFV